MSLEATHIRFALDVKDKYKVKDVRRYIVGAIYPDSRYVTGIDRLLTHPNDYLSWNLEGVDDFKKGWFVHLLADKIQMQITKEKLPEIFDGEMSQGSEAWIRYTAIKILQDLDDVSNIDTKICLSYLKYPENPNNENMQVLQRYYRIFSKMYTDLSKVNINVYYEMWKEFGISDDMFIKIKDKVKEYSDNLTIMAVVHKIYQEMLNRI